VALVAAAFLAALLLLPTPSMAGAVGNPAAPAAALPTSSAQALVDYLNKAWEAPAPTPSPVIQLLEHQLEAAALKSQEAEEEDEMTLDEISNLLLHSDDDATQTDDSSSSGTQAAAFVTTAAAHSPFAFQPSALTPETLAALAVLTPGSSVGPAAATPSPSSQMLRWFLQSIAISGDTLFKLRVGPEVEEALQNSIRNSVSGQSAVAPERVEVIAAANVTLPFAFCGVDWEAPAAAPALRAALERLGGGFDRGHIQVALVSPLTTATTSTGKSLARRLLQAAAAAAATPQQSSKDEAFVTATFSDMSISNATSLLDSLGAACGANHSLTADRPLACRDVLLADLKASGAVANESAYAVRLRDKPASTITLTLGLGLTTSEVASGAEAKAASWFSGRELRSFLRTLNLTATPLTGLASLLPGLGGGQGSPSITVTITPPGQSPALGANAAGLNNNNSSGSGSGSKVNPGWVAGIAVAGGIGLAALAGVVYLIASRRRSGSSNSSDKSDDVSSADGDLASTGAALGRRRRRGRRIYNQQKDLTTQLAQARAMAARAREEAALREEELRRQEAAAAAVEQEQQQQDQRRHRQVGASHALGVRGSAAGSLYNCLERGDSVMSAARFELDEAADDDAASTAATASSSVTTSRLGSQLQLRIDSTQPGARLEAAARAAAAAAAADAAATSAAATAGRSRGVAWSDDGDENDVELVARRNGVAVAATNAVSGTSSSSSIVVAPPRAPSLPISSTAAPSISAPLPSVAPPSVSSAQTESTPTTPTAGLVAAHIKLVAQDTSDGLTSKSSMTGVGGFRMEEAPPGEEVEETYGDPSEPLPVRPVPGRLATPFSASNYPASAEDEW